MFKNKSSLGWILKRGEKNLWKIFLLSLLGIAMSYFSVRFALLSKNVVDIATGNISGSLLTAVISLAILIAIQLLIHIAYTVIEVRLSCKIFNNIQKKAFSTVLKGDYLKVSKTHSAEIVNRLYSDVSVVTDGIMSILPQYFTLLSQILFSIIALFLIDKELALVCIVVFPVVSFATHIYGKKIKPLYKKCQSANGVVKSHIQECMQNLLAIKAFAKETYFTASLSKVQQISYKLSVKKGIITILANLLFFVLMTFGYYLALIWCSYKISVGIMTVGTLTAVLQLVDQLQGPFKGFSSVISGTYSTIASAERIIEIEDTATGICEEKAECPAFESIAFSNVHFSYNEEKIFEDASMFVKSGQIIGIMGSSGIGKSTMMHLVMGILKPDKGSVSINGKETSFKNLFAYVPQGNMILSGTIGENIALCENIDADRLKTATENADIYEYIKTLPLGFDTVLGEGGLGLSEGQIQRLALARAFYSDNPVILLDEATSALDEATEEKVLSNIKNMKNKTCIIITHRKKPEKICDKVLFIDNKKIIELKSKE